MSWVFHKEYEIIYFKTDNGDMLLVKILGFFNLCKSFISTEVKINSNWNGEAREWCLYIFLNVKRNSTVLGNFKCKHYFVYRNK